MADLAKFVAVSTGTKWRLNSDSQWKEASLNDPLLQNYQSEDINNKKYGVELLGEAEIDFLNVEATVELSAITGEVWFRTNSGSARVITPCTLENTLGIAVKSGGSVCVTCSAKGGYRPPRWPLYE